MNPHVPRRGWLVPIGAVLILMAMGAKARADATNLSCPVVRQLVRAAGGLDPALEQARARGYSETQIQAVIRRCGLR